MHIKAALGRALFLGSHRGKDTEALAVSFFNEPEIVCFLFAPRVTLMFTQGGEPLFLQGRKTELQREREGKREREREREARFFQELCFVIPG